MRFLGPLPDGELMKKLAGAYIYVLPSEREGQSIATPEAMAAGTPKAVAAADGNGAVSLVRRAGSGLLVRPNPGHWPRASFPLAMCSFTRPGMRRTSSRSTASRS